MTLAEIFAAGALHEVQAQIDQLSGTLTSSSALALPETQYRDIVIAGREAQLTIFRQAGVPLPEQVLVTVQIARYGLGGVTSYRIERGPVFAPGSSARDATQQELLESGG